MIKIFVNGKLYKEVPKAEFNGPAIMSELLGEGHRIKNVTMTGDKVEITTQIVCVGCGE